MKILLYNIVPYYGRKKEKNTKNSYIILNVEEAEDLKKEADAAEVIQQKAEAAIQKTAEKNVRNMRKQLNRNKRNK